MEINSYVKDLVQLAIAEDIGDGDHTSRACIPEDHLGKVQLLAKQEGIIAGVDVAEYVFLVLDPMITFTRKISDGKEITPGDIVFFAEGRTISLLQAERLVLNIMQRMSGVATQTRFYTQKLKGLKTKILDTRKTTPGMRILDKWAVNIGGGVNHRMGLFDMILIKDNHIDFAGGIENAIHRTKEYLTENNKSLKIEIEARNLEDVKTIVKTGGVNRILLDNFSIEQTKAAVQIINTKYETESSGGITIENIRDYAACGVDYVSVGALTHQIKSLDLSLKAVQ